MKYKVGDKVRVISNITDHEFEIGAIVEVRSLDSNGDIFDCKKIDGSDWWCMENQEVEPIDPIDPAPDYRALYEQEKALHEALKKYLSVIEKVDSSDPMEKLLWNNYQQLKQQYGQDTETTS